MMSSLEVFGTYVQANQRTSTYTLCSCCIGICVGPEPTVFFIFLKNGTPGLLRLLVGFYYRLRDTKY